MTKALKPLFLSKGAITDVIGVDPLRLYPLVLIQSSKINMLEFPAVSYRSLSTRATDDFDEASTFDFVSVDFWTYGHTIQEATGLANLIRDQLNGAKGIFNGVVINDVRFSTSGIDDYSEKLDKYTHHIELIFNIRR